MRLGFDAKRLFFNETGLGNYSRNLVDALYKVYPNHHYYLMAAGAKRSHYYQHYDLNYEIIQPKVNFLWRSSRIQRQINQYSLDIYHGLSHELPLQAYNISHCKKVVTIHDLIFKSFPGHYPFIDRNLYDIKCRYACRIADRIVAISHATKNAIMKYYNIKDHKIDVIHQSCAQRFLHVHRRTDIEAFIESHSLPQDYLLSVGSIIERKNLLRVLQAFKQSQIEHSLIVVGSGKGRYEQVVKKYVVTNQLQNKVIFLDNVSHKNLPLLYQGAAGLIYPSIQEGFGIPVIEALFSRIPVLTSNVSSLPEAAGPGAFLVDPYSVDDIGVALNEMVSTDTTRRTEMGFSYAENNFSAQRFASKTMMLYESLLS